MEAPKYWREQPARYRLEGSNCQACGIKHFPERPICPDCGTNRETGKKEVKIERVSGDIYAAQVIGQAQAPTEQVPNSQMTLEQTELVPVS
jgi:uncharacterized OB-fold protein